MASMQLFPLNLYTHSFTRRHVALSVAALDSIRYYVTLTSSNKSETVIDSSIIMYYSDCTIKYVTAVINL